MCDEYLRKYHIETRTSMWGNFRRRRGLDMRISRDELLIPWHVLPAHRWRYPVQMLRAEARSRAGLNLRAEDIHRLPPWRDFLRAGDVVVHYEPQLETGFVYVPREVFDTDIIRDPRSK
jgi:hypothetical protein